MEEVSVFSQVVRAASARLARARPAFTGCCCSLLPVQRHRLCSLGQLRAQVAPYRGLGQRVVALPQAGGLPPLPRVTHYPRHRRGAAGTSRGRRERPVGPVERRQPAWWLARHAAGVVDSNGRVRARYLYFRNDEQSLAPPCGRRAFTAALRAPWRACAGPCQPHVPAPRASTSCRWGGWAAGPARGDEIIDVLILSFISIYHSLAGSAHPPRADPAPRHVPRPR